MRKIFCTLMLIFCINILSYSQIIRESIPEFAEKLLTLNKASAKNNIINRGFDLLPYRTLISLGYDEESLGNIIVGMGDMNITCKIQTNNTGRYVEKVSIGGVRYSNAKYMISEYQMAGYTIDEEKSTRSELIFVKQNGRYHYFAFVSFMVNPYMCLANAEFKRMTPEMIRKEKEKQKVIAKQEEVKRRKAEELAKRQELRERKEKELAIQERINNNNEFSKKELASEAKINWNGIKSIYDNRISLFFETSGLDSRMYYVHIDENGTLVADKNDDSFINKCVLSTLESSRHIPAKILFKNDSVAVKTEITLKAKSIEKEYTLNVKKSKKGWELKDDIGRSSERVKTVVSELVELLNSNSDLSQLKNKTYLLKANIVTHYIGKSFVQETFLSINSRGFNSSAPIYSKHYPFTEYKSLETEKIRVVYAD